MVGTLTITLPNSKIVIHTLVRFQPKAHILHLDSFNGYSERSSAELNACSVCALLRNQSTITHGKTYRSCVDTLPERH